MNTCATRMTAGVGWSVLWYAVSELIYGILRVLIHNSILPPVDWYRFTYEAVLVGYGLCGWIWIFRLNLCATRRNFLVIAAVLTGLVIVLALLANWLQDRQNVGMTESILSYSFTSAVSWYALGTWLLVTAWIIARAQRAAPRSACVMCPDCGYNMRGLTHATCPECGVEHTLDQLVSNRRETTGRS